MKRLRVTAFLVSFSLVICSTGLVGAKGKDKIPEYFEKSFQYERRGEMTPALNEVRKILAIEPNNYTATLRAGWLWYLQRRHKDSITYYRRAISLAPEAIEPQLGLMLPLMGSHQWKEAEEVARKILKHDPMNYYANSRLAFILFSRSKYDQALEEYVQVLKGHPSDAEMQLGLGWTYYRKGRGHWKTAQEWFAKVLSVKPANASARQGMNLVRMGLQSAGKREAQETSQEVETPPGLSEQISAKSYSSCECCWNPAQYMDSSWMATELHYSRGDYHYVGLSPAECRAAGGLPCGGGRDCE
jgi:Tfp pilus assembly protein PilF